MDADELERLCSALSIQELEGPVNSLDEGMKNIRERKLAFCLVGKVMTKVLVNKEAFIKVFTTIWKVSEWVDIEWVEGNIFTFQFFNMEDQNRIINGGPWNFDKVVVVLKMMPLDGDITNLKFNKVEFWIQVHKIPHLCMLEEIGLFLGKLISDVQEIDLVTAREENNRYLRVRVVVRISEPLVRSLRMDLIGIGKITMMLLRYERLQDYCFKCRRIGHGIRDCPVEGDIKEVMSEANYRLCMWLRTGSPPKKPQNRFGRHDNMSRGNQMVTYSSKNNRMNHGRLQDHWRNPKGISKGKAGVRKGSSSKSSWREKEKRPLVSNDGCMGSHED
ncbi:hypothetical protein EZV62_001740 [Acer yangbiense]|uniref:CCHC-type domain-containing protein n=1 Tax=Acer yangbiense TaxID=1000413 RepID=A0A5C7IV54_9ROSI|nr:hypothetical protein EZV62_001740 [Acer yangbiense]